MKEKFLNKILLNGYKPSKPNLLLIPESRQRPFTLSKLYRKVRRFLKGQGLDEKYHIVFISNLTGICPEEFAEEEIFVDSRVGRENVGTGFIPVRKNVIQETGGIIGKYLEKTADDYAERIVYARGSYLASVKIGSCLSQIKIETILNDEDIERLRKQGIKWMKIGLRLPGVFSIFEKRMQGVTRSESPQVGLFDERVQPPSAQIGNAATVDQELRIMEVEKENEELKKKLHE